MKEIGYLLRDINVVREKSLKRELQEDCFNLFTILKKESDETFLHSRFISSLLDIKGSHKLGNKLLDLFLVIINSSFKYESATVEIHPNNLERSEYKRIDILLIDRMQNSAIIIENKIYSGDSNSEEDGQLERYYKRIIEEDRIPEDNIEVYYLTLDGHEPSEESLSTMGCYPMLSEKVKCISYSQEILNWMKKCVKECYDKPALRESIIQYIKLIEHMTNNDITIEERKELMRIIGNNDDNLFSAKMLIDNMKHVYWHTLYEFWKELSEGFQKQGYNIVQPVLNETIDTLVHGGPKQRKIDLDLVITTENKLPIYVSSEYGDWLFWGIYNDENYAIPENYHAAIKSLVKENNEYNEYEDWICWKYLSCTEEEKICCSDFLCDGTFRLISFSKRHEIIKKIINEINTFVVKLENMSKIRQ